jgi:hypothetical protein
MALAVACGHHPKRVAAQRCPGCNTPICALCVVPTTLGDLCKPCAQAAAHVRATGQTDFSLTIAGVTLVGMVAGLFAWAIELYFFIHGGVAGEVTLWSFVSYCFMAGGIVGTAISMAAGRRSGLLYGLVAFASTVVGYLVVVFGWALHEVYDISGNAIIIWVPGFLIHTTINAGLAGLVAAGMVSVLKR